MGKFEEIELKKIIGFQNGFAFKSKLFKNNGLPIVRISNLQVEVTPEHRGGVGVGPRKFQGSQPTGSPGLS